MLEITIDNCPKFDLETLIDLNDSNIFGLIEEIQKLKPNVHEKLYA